MALSMTAIVRLLHGKNLKYYCRRFKWMHEEFISHYISLHNDCFPDFGMKDFQAAQFHKNVFSLREGFASFVGIVA